MGRETVRVRIAVAVNDVGEWTARGWLDADDEDAAFAARVSHAEPSSQIVWVEADIPLPRPQTIPGEVVGGQDA